MVTDIAR